MLRRTCQESTTIGSPKCSTSNPLRNQVRLDTVGSQAKVQDWYRRKMIGPAQQSCRWYYIRVYDFRDGCAGREPRRWDGLLKLQPTLYITPKSWHLRCMSNVFSYSIFRPKADPYIDFLLHDDDDQNDITKSHHFFFANHWADTGEVSILVAHTYDIYVESYAFLG